MAEFWLKQTGSHAPEGPYSDAKIAAMRRKGKITGDSMLSTDNVNWTWAIEFKAAVPQQMKVSATPSQLNFGPGVGLPGKQRNLL